ncbi:MAG TPA: ferrous iron transporter B [Fibrobacteria bacterium]|nr:ferrous iron transporter B [Fibrobacteria bacterium]HOX51767.1 ferrous iron transporter B [Fibrobacteria bacterium]
MNEARIIVLLGAPNAGKTSLYNHLTGSRFKTVNYPGATVEYSVGRLRAPGESASIGAKAPDCHVPDAKVEPEAGSIQVIDTPGIVSIIPRSEDEKVALTALGALDTLLVTPHRTPHALVCVVDATQPARHLPVVREAMKAGFPVVVALTMNDLARRKGQDVDSNRLSELLGTPVVEVDGRSGIGVTDLVSAIESILPDHPVNATLPRTLDDDRIQDNFHWADTIAARTIRNGSTQPGSLNPGLGRLDRIVLHPILGLVVFVAAMTGLFWLVFSAAAPFMDLVEGFFGWLGQWVGEWMPDGLAKGLVVDGVIAGAGAVSVFIPQIAILFLALGLLEDSGYLARGSMIIDRLLVTIGLNGKSFVPLLSGAACAIPAALAARTITGRRERLLTLLVIPLMSCSARLPVWGLLLGFLVPPDRTLLGGFALAGIYVLSIAFASVAAVVGGRILRIEPSQTGFQVELPHWRPPTFRTVVVSAWDRTVSYVKRAGLTILAISIVFWALMTFPDPGNSAMSWLGRLIAPILAPMGLDWKVGAALIAAFAAREVFVSALGVIYAVQGTGDSVDGLLAAMRQATFEGTSQLVFTPASVAGLVVFFLIALQCMTTVAVMRREVSTRFALGQMAAFVAVAWVLAVATVQGLRLAGIP